MGPETENKVTRMVWLDEYGRVQIDVSNPLDVTARIDDKYGQMHIGISNPLDVTASIDMVDWSTDCSVDTTYKWCDTRTATVSSIFEDWNSDGTIDAIRQWADARKMNEEKKEKKEPMRKGILIKRVIFDGPATIVFWDDGTKTIVKCTENDSYSYEVGIAMCTLKKLFGDQYGAYRHDVRNAIKEAEERKKKKESKGETTMDDAIGLAKIAIGIMESLKKG